MRTPPVTLPHLEPFRDALAEGQYDVAFALLEDVAQRLDDPRQRALYQLHLAAADALYGPGGVEHGLLALRDAAREDPETVHLPLYRAVHWEFRALQGATSGDVRKGIASIGSDDPLAAFHAASALWWAGASRSAKRRLLKLHEDDLPLYLRWRRWSLLGHAHADTGDPEAAAEAFAVAYDGATESERPLVRLHLAGALLESNRAEEARRLLGEQPDDALAPLDRGWWFDLSGRVELDLDNPQRALENLDEARRYLDDPVRLVDVDVERAHALSALGRADEAAELLGRVARDAEEGERSNLLHECAVAWIDADEPDAAFDVLSEVLLDPDYAYRAEATADLADVQVRRGELAEARTLAFRALDDGATAPACLVLGTIAYEYFDLEDATTWLERAITASQPGDGTWLSAQSLIADVFAQRGSAFAERLLQHARAALDHAPPGSEWVAALEAHVARAKQWLFGQERWLN